MWMLRRRSRKMMVRRKTDPVEMHMDRVQEPCCMEM